MAHFACPTRGTTVIYLNPQPGNPESFGRAVVCGPGVEDPATGETWVPARLPGGGRELLDPALIVDVLPPTRPAA